MDEGLVFNPEVGYMLQSASYPPSAEALALIPRERPRRAKYNARMVAYLDHLIMSARGVVPPDRSAWSGLLEALVAVSGFDVETLTSKSRRHDLLAARRAIWGVGYGWFGLSLPVLGAKFGRGHHTVLYAIRSIADVMGWPADEAGFKNAMADYARVLTGTARPDAVDADIMPGRWLRLIYLDHVLETRGRVTPGHLVDMFGLSRATACEDFRLFHIMYPWRAVIGWQHALLRHAGTGAVFQPAQYAAMQTVLEVCGVKR